MCIIFSGYVIFIIWKIITELQLPNFTDLNYRKLLFFLLIFTDFFTENYCTFYRNLLLFSPIFTERFYWKILNFFTENYSIFTGFYPTEIYCYWTIFFTIYRPLPLPNFLENPLPTHPYSRVFFSVNWSPDSLEREAQFWTQSSRQRKAKSMTIIAVWRSTDMSILGCV